MDGQTEVAGGDAISYAHVPAGNEPLTEAQAARSLADARYKREAQGREPENNTAESADDATADTELASQEADTAPLEEATGETQEDAPAERPQRELPRSWTKDRAERWSNLDPDTQDFLLEQDRTASTEVRRVQNEAAEERKAAQAERQKAEQVRQDYEVGLKAAREVLEREQRQKFPDIKSWDDYERLSAEASRLSTIEPFQSLQIANYLKDFDTHQRSLQVNAHQTKVVEDQKAEEQTTKTLERKQRETKLLVGKVPELSDPKKMTKAQTEVVEYLRNDLEMSDLDLSEWGKNPITDDHRFQLLALKAMKYDALQKIKPVAVPKPVPNVQRPGAGKSVNTGKASQIQALTQRLNTATGMEAMRLGAQITRLRRAG